MPGLRHRRHDKNRPGQARAIQAEAEVRPQLRPSERYAARAAVRPGRVTCDFLQSELADYESNSRRLSSRADVGSNNKNQHNKKSKINTNENNS
jgi:hypothetical protein